jgi:hypothetical protein
MTTIDVKACQGFMNLVTGELAKLLKVLVTFLMTIIAQAILL